MQTAHPFIKSVRSDLPFGRSWPSVLDPPPSKPGACLGSDLWKFWERGLHTALQAKNAPQVDLEALNKSSELQARDAAFVALRQPHSRPHICMICGRAFSQLSNLQRHERIHTGSRPFSCKVCKKTFCDSSNLLRHERIHTGHRPYLCGVCGKSFSILSNMRRHERIHAERRVVLPPALEPLPSTDVA